MLRRQQARAQWGFMPSLKKINVLVALLALMSPGLEVSGQKKSSPQKRAEENNSPLMFAARDNNADAIKKLIAAGAAVNAKNALGSTPLMWAASAGSIDAVKCLLAAGAEVNARTRQGKTALSLTIEYFSPNHNEQNKYAFALIVRELIASGANIRSKEDIGLTPLLWAAVAGNRDIAAELIDAGADVNMKSRIRIQVHQYLTVTPLIYSIINCTDEKSGTLEVVKLLLERGANVNARDSKGRTALDWAEEEKDEEIVNILRSTGARQ
jgi:ankyrin repeat protein